jgi:hypothetical protein
VPPVRAETVTAVPVPELLPPAEDSAFSSLGRATETREPLDWVDPLADVEPLVEEPPAVLPAPELPPVAETDRLTEPGRLAETSDPPLP